MEALLDQSLASLTSLENAQCLLILDPDSLQCGEVPERPMHGFYELQRHLLHSHRVQDPRGRRYGQLRLLLWRLLRLPTHLRTGQQPEQHLH